jgi:hypothetical protein
MTETPEELPVIDDGVGLADHPEEVTEEEAEAGRRLYKSVDDLDDEAEWPA